MSGPTDPYIPFVPGPANPNVPGSLTHSLLNFNFGTKVAVADVGFSIAGLDGSQLLPLANVPPLTSANVTDFHQTAAAAAPVQAVAGFTGSVSVGQLASVLPAVQAGTPKGLYDVSTNTPTLSTGGGGGVVGDVYTVSVAGTMSIDGVGALAIGNRIQNTGTLWVPIATPQGAGTFTDVMLTGAQTFSDAARMAIDTNNGTVIVSDKYGRGVPLVDTHGVLAMPDPARIGTITGLGLQFSNPSAGVTLISGADGTPLLQGGAGTAQSFAAANTPGVAFASSAALVTDAVGYTDKYGRYISAVLSGGILATPGGSGGGGGVTYGDFSFAEVTAFDADVIALGNTLNSRPRKQTQPIIDGLYNFGAGYGQSLSLGNGGLGPVDTSPFSSLIMQGQTPAFVSTAGVLAPHNDALLHGLECVGQQPYQVSAMNLFRRMDAAFRGYPIGSGTTTRRMGLNLGGIGGKTIELLSYGGPIDTGNTQNYFTGLGNMIQSLHDFAVTNGTTLVIPVIMFSQGQANYSTPSAAQSASAYGALLSQLIDDVWNHLIQPILGQDYPPLWIIQQTGGLWTVDNAGAILGIAQGQINVCNARQDCVLGLPEGVYQNDPAQGNHPSANGYRNMGDKNAQIMHEVMNLGRGFDYMRPLDIMWRGQTIAVGFNPKRGPIQFKNSFSGLSLQDQTSITYAAKGFAVSDSSGPISIAAPYIVGNGTVILPLTRVPVSPPVVTHGTLAVGNGTTFLADSDDMQDFNQYSYNSSMPAGANITALIGTNYPLNNWAKYFNQTARGV